MPKGGHFEPPTTLSVTELLLASGSKVDLNGEAGGLILDADADTHIGANTDNVVVFTIAGAADFHMLADIFRALAGSQIQTDTINETTGAAGVTIDGMLIKDGIMGTIPVITGDGAITIANSTVHLTKATAAAITIAAPTVGTHDGIKIWVVTETAQAHVITCASNGFNGKGSSGTVTFTAAIGNAVLLHARNGIWYTPVKTGVTVA